MSFFLKCVYWLERERERQTDVDFVAPLTDAFIGCFL